MTGARRLAVVLVAALIAPVVGLIGVVGAELVPDGRITFALLRSIDSGDLTADNYLDTALGNHVDKFTDCILLGTGLGDPPGRGVVSRALASPTLGGCRSAVRNLERFRRTGELQREYDYFRYWHGGAVITRPSVGLFGVQTTRALVAVALIAATVALVAATRRMVGLVGAVALVVPLVVATDWWDLPESFPHAMTVTAMMAGAALSLVAVRRVSASPWSTVAAAAACGALFAYVDLLTIPPAALLITIALSGVRAHVAGWSTRRVVREQSVAALGWLVGFAWMWMSKWVLASSVLGIDRVWGDVIDQAGRRVGGDDAGVTSGFGAAAARNLEAWFDRPLAIVVTAAVGLVVLVGWMRSSPSLRSRRLLLAAPALVPLVWWEILSNHSQVHAWFTHRSMALALGVVAVAFVVPAATASDAPPSVRADS